jgi:hypothetical protein
VWERRDEKVAFAQRSARVDIEIANARNFSPYFNHVLLIDSTLSGGQAEPACGIARIAYKRNDQETPSPAIVRRFEPDARRHVHQLGAEIPLRLGNEGRLAIEMECAPGSTWDIHRIAVYSARGAGALRGKLLVRTD